jgi:hypothetical protein
MQLNPTRPNDQVWELSIVEQVELDLMVAQLIYTLTGTEFAWPWPDGDGQLLLFSLNLRETS